MLRITTPTLRLLLLTVVVVVIVVIHSSSSSSLLGCDAFVVLNPSHRRHHPIVSTTTTTTTLTTTTTWNPFYPPLGRDGVDSTTTTTTSRTTLHSSSSEGQEGEQQQPQPNGSDSGTVVYIDRDFRLSVLFLIGSYILGKLPLLKFVLSPIVGLLGIVFLIQTFRLKFVCDINTFQLQKSGSASGKQEENEEQVGENILVGGENRWTYDSFVNYEFFPKGWIDQPQGPILVYFKETQTPRNKWDAGPGRIANSDEAIMNKGAIPGQVHFFPALCNCQQLKSIWEQKGCAKIE